MKVIVTVPPYAGWLERATAPERVRGVRLNTVMPVAHELPVLLAGLRQRVGAREVWVDLKCRQLRVAAAAYVPYHHVELSHPIEVRTPVTARFMGGEATATVVRVEGNRLILADTPPIPLGAGMSVHLLDPSLRILGYLTARDREYVAAARAIGLHTYMLSYVERSQDIEDLLALDPEARILAKIESPAGLAWAEGEYRRYAGRVNLIAARGDLYVELAEPGRILPALRAIRAADPDAVAASRILSSVAGAERPACAEVSDVAWLAALGYRSLLLGDELSYREEIQMRALAELEGILKFV